MNASDPAAGPLSEPVDLTNCDREPIHLISAIQPNGFLVAVSTDWLISRVSANAPDFVGGTVDALLGASLKDVFGLEAVHTLRNRLAILRGADAVERAFGVPLREDGVRFDLAIHMSGGEIVIEAEPSEPETELNPSAMVQSMLARLKPLTDLGDLLKEAARQVRALTGHHRVMIYRFHPDGSGEVVAERVRAGLEPFLGLRYPASDIPKQARALMERNVVRVAADVKATPTLIVPQLGPEGEPLDLSMSTLRAHSPIHIEYLKNMGVGATLTISLLRGGRLWGLIACHHTTARPVSYERRTAAELFAQVLSLMIETREREAVSAYEQRTRQVHDGLMAAIVESGSTAESLAGMAESLSEIVPCDGMVVRIGTDLVLTGFTPTRDELVPLLRFLDQSAASKVLSLEALGRAFPPARDYADRAAGMLAIPVSRTPRDYLIFFRREVTQSITWAGDPAKPAEVGPNGVRLTPRKSFEAWQEIIRGHGAPWTEPELRAADALRVTILEVVLRLTGVADQERERAAQRQDLLIAELNHRVRNILGLIRGLITQSRGGATDVESFAATIGGRVQALARAHDQITLSNWGPRALSDLIVTEAAAYLQAGETRVQIDGPPVKLHPEAFATLALVLHEMVTNAAKYGALCDQSGLVSIHWSLVDGDLVLQWRETGGPPVQAPTRRGFGTTIIERSVPHDLGGEARIDYALHGLKARFVVPARFVELGVVVPPAAPTPDVAVPAFRLSGSVLLVEDSMIIAMDAEEMLAALGAETVRTAGDVAEALRLIEAEIPTFAFLDVNLGRELSFPIADRLRQAGVPYVFATGYGEEIQLPPEHQGRIVIKKPYTAETIAAGAARTNGSGG
ncbi:two-component system sensor histidine kinase/response regulator [Brevundimonas sp. LM2]|uniref:HWE histidine kinase domain-containing protein n=1 Tax=Brevundimonas sp. LM2 TaxID=1938605 RepID=UPI000983A7DC|nr:HWE histidine kinase domain-containing protein [Brevundimonas sp. LM2]AQR60254.1 two-component system sensor histidine kinase/response regulator [Brevundimonas sp. LM2]